MSAEIGEGGRGGRALRQVRLRIPITCFPNVVWSNRGADASEQIGDGFGIAHGAKKCLDSCAGNGGEEIFQVHFQHDALADVRSHEGFDGVSFQESMHGGMGWDLLENFGKDFSLERFEARLGCLDQANCARLLEHAVMIVAQLRTAFAVEVKNVGEPFEVGHSECQPIG